MRDGSKEGRSGRQTAIHVYTYIYICAYIHTYMHCYAVLGYAM